MRAWGCIPIADQISIAKEGQEHSRSGLDPVAGCQSEIPSRRTAGHRDTLRVEVKSLRALAAQPPERVLDILDDRRQFRFGCQAIVERDQDVAVGGCEVFQCVAEVLAMAHDQRASVERNHRRPHFCVGVMVHVRLDLECAGLLVNHRLFLRLVRGHHIESDA